MSRPAIVVTLLLLVLSDAWGGNESCGKNHYILTEPCVMTAVDAPIGAVGALAFDPSGVLHFSSPSVVFKLQARMLTRVAGTGQPGFTGDGGPAVNAQLSFEQAYDDLPWWEYLSFLGGIA